MTAERAAARTIPFSPLTNVVTQRYFAFGRLYLKARLGALERGQRFDIYRWLKGLWNDSAFGVLDQFHIPGLVTRRRRRAWADEGWNEHRRQLMDAGLIGADEARLAEDHAAAGAAA